MMMKTSLFIFQFSNVLTFLLFYSTPLLSSNAKSDWELGFLVLRLNLTFNTSLLFNTREYASTSFWHCVLFTCSVTQLKIISCLIRHTENCLGFGVLEGEYFLCMQTAFTDGEDYKNQPFLYSFSPTPFPLCFLNLTPLPSSSQSPVGLGDKKS